jgi:hypothetical protein
MSNYQVYTGFWIDNSHSAVLGATLTLPIRWASYVVSALTVAVTISATSFWIVAACIFYQFLVRHENVDVVGFQHRVILRNSSSPLGKLWEIIKVRFAWRSGTIPRVGRRTIFIAVPSLLTWLLITAASVFVSEVASKSYTEIGVLLIPKDCGVWHYNTETIAELAAQTSKGLRDTIRGRAYAGSWYENSTTALATASIFPVESLPLRTEGNTTCPFSESRCISGENSAFSMKTPLLDSHTIFGINAKEGDRVQLQKNVTCAVVRTGDMLEVVNKTILQFYLGPITDETNFTYLYNEAIASESVDYMLL